MSRSGYSDDGDYDQWATIRWRGAVASAVRGRRGQAMLTELLTALDAMPVKELIADELVEKDGAVCALGALAGARGIDVSSVDPDDSETVAGTFGIATALAQETVWMNDEGGGYWNKETPAQRWARMRAWVASQIGATA